MFVIAFASNPENLLDIIPSREILQKGYPKYEIEIIGLAQGYEEALQVVLRIIDETYQNTGNTDVRAYMEKIPNNYKTVAEGENR